MQSQKYFFKNLFQYPVIFRGIIISIFAIIYVVLIVSSLFDKTAAGFVLILSFFALSRITANLSKKLIATITITNDFIEVSIPEIVSILNIKRIKENIKWNNIISVEIKDSDKGTITLTTKKRIYSFGYADKFKTNEKLVKLIKDKKSLRDG